MIQVVEDSGTGKCLFIVSIGLKLPAISLASCGKSLKCKTNSYQLWLQTCNDPLMQEKFNACLKCVFFHDSLMP